MSVCLWEKFPGFVSLKEPGDQRGWALQLWQCLSAHLTRSSDSCLVVKRYMEEERKTVGFSFSSCCLRNRSHCYLESLECMIEDLK